MPAMQRLLLRSIRLKTGLNFWFFCFKTKERKKAFGDEEICKSGARKVVLLE